ncbi:unnamed protein product [Schistocephalus solidus]|uniref:Secreted protein n=1 Tax=Schistocephalus solidus TaxID=70667 RepID=A0A183T5D4_SCHSO|nr:unnamed protein product [Schistocephalus solidus]
MRFLGLCAVIGDRDLLPDCYKPCLFVTGNLFQNLIKEPVSLFLLRLWSLDVRMEDCLRDIDIGVHGPAIITNLDGQFSDLTRESGYSSAPSRRGWSFGFPTGMPSSWKLGFSCTVGTVARPLTFARCSSVISLPD